MRQRMYGNSFSVVSALSFSALLPNCRSRSESAATTGRLPLAAMLEAALLAVALLMSGCASANTMPFAKDARARPESDKAVFLMTVTSKNVYRPSFQPKLVVVNVERTPVKGSDDRVDFLMDDWGKTETNSPTTGNEYLIRLQLDRGDYVIRGLACQNLSFPIIASFFVPLHSKLTVNGPGVYYLGHVDATVREGNGKEFAAGGAFPLLDQSVAGASGGTFDISITDRWDGDSPRFMAMFPGLAGSEVQKMILPPFDRETAQRLWEETRPKNSKSGKR